MWELSGTVLGPWLPEDQGPGPGPLGLPHCVPSGESLALSESWFLQL